MAETTKPKPVAKPMHGPLGLKMSEEEIGEYLTGLLRSDQAGDLTLAGLERQCLDGFKEVAAEQAQKSTMLNRLRAQEKVLEADLQAASGRRQTYVQLLIAAEEGRRNAARKDLELVSAGDEPAATEPEGAPKG